MADEHTGRVGDESDDVDAGEPIGLLADLAQEPRPGFVDGIRRRIQRKTLAGDTVHFWWTGLPFVLLEFVKMFVQLTTRRADGQEMGDGRDD
jgi:hypothetical protein